VRELGKKASLEESVELESTVELPLKLELEELCTMFVVALLPAWLWMLGDCDAD